MRKLLVLCAILFPAGALADPVEPDEIARSYTESLGWQALPGDDANDAIEMVTREAIAVEARMMDSGNYNLPSFARDEIVLRERLQMPGLDPTNQYIERYSLIKRFTLPNGQEVAVRKTLDNEEIQQRQLAFGASNKAMAEAFMKGANAIALTGGVIDAQIAASDFGNNPLFDGMEGSRLLGMMLSNQRVQGEATNFMGEVVKDEDGNPVPVDYGKGCDVLANDDIEYSETAAVGISPVTGKFSASMFLAGGACMFKMISGRFYIATQSEGMADGEMTSLQEIVRQLGETFGNSLVFHGYEGPANDQIAVVGITGLAMVEELPDGGTLTINEMRKGIDADAYVPRYLAYHGIVQQNGETKPVVWQTRWDNYEAIPGTALYEPRRQVLGFSGVLSEDEQAQMAEAEQQLAEFEKQLASMPASQREMMKSMIGPQIEQFRSMAQGGGVEFETITATVEVNPNMMDPNNSLAAMVGEDQQELLVKQIQKDLDTLGYDPGPMSGELTPQTVATIEAFEADNGMPVTGAATMELVNELTIKVLSRN